MRVPRSLGALGAVLAVLLAGCGRADGDAGAWADKVCGAMLGFRDGISAAAPRAAATDPTSRARQLSDFTGNALAAVKAARNDLDAAGAAPVEGGTDVIATLTERMTRIQTAFATAKAQVDAVNPADPGADAALLAAVSPLQSLTNLPDPAAALAANPDLRAAVDAAPRCQQLRGSGESIGR